MGSRGAASGYLPLASATETEIGGELSPRR